MKNLNLSRFQRRDYFKIFQVEFLILMDETFFVVIFINSVSFCTKKIYPNQGINLIKSF